MSHAALQMTLRRRVAFARGVTLIELMVGMMIGLLAVLIISQVLLVSEGQKRTTTAGADAQVNGALSIFTIQRDVQAAGYGFSSSPNLLGCQIKAQFNGAMPAGFPSTLAPVIITPKAGAAIGDSIRILASSKPTYTVPTRVIPPAYAVNGQSFPVSSSLGFLKGDLGLVAADATQPCWVFQVTDAPTAKSIPRVDDPTKWNTAGSPDQAYVDGSILINLGTLIDNRYEINLVNNVPVLQLSSFDISNPAVRTVRDIQSDIVGMRIYYGRDTSTPLDGVVDVYDQTTPATNADWLRVLTVRLIVVSRSGQYEKEIVTPANPRWEVGATPPTFDASASAPCAGQCVSIDVGAGAVGDVDAKHYRYKVFETIVPLRNMLWSS